MKTFSKFYKSFAIIILCMLHAAVSAAPQLSTPSQPACTAPTDLKAEVVQSDWASWVYVATVSWTGIPGGVYEYTFSVTWGEGSGTTSQTSFSTSGSLENSPLIFSVRTKCEDGSFSEWVTGSADFPPAYCPKPTDVTIVPSTTGFTASFSYPVKDGYLFGYTVLDTTGITSITWGGSLNPLLVLEGMLRPGTAYILRLEIYCDPNIGSPVHELDFPFRTLSNCETQAGCFTLVNADTNEDILELRDGDVFVKPAHMSVNVRYGISTPVASVMFNHNGANVRIENERPFLLAGNVGDDYLPWKKGVAGEHTITATRYSGRNATGDAGPPHSVSFTIREEHPFFTVVDADTDEDIQDLRYRNDFRISEVIYTTNDLNINLRFNPVDTPASVVFKYNYNEVRVDNAPPFALAEESNGDYEAWDVDQPLDPRVHAIGYSEPNGQGEITSMAFVMFHIREGCTAEGSILREYWANVSGAKVSDIPVDTEPTTTNYLSIFEGPTNLGTNYGTRIRGYVCPPATGNYTFWIASNDQSELWLSSGQDSDDKVLIASLPGGGVPPRAWTVRPSTQQSDPVYLVARKPYYIEALHKQGTGSDNLSVGWQLPDGTLERPVPGYRLSPFHIQPAPGAITVARLNSINVFPNPSYNGASLLHISGNGMDSGRAEALVEILNISGEVIFKQKLDLSAARALIRLKEPLVPGVYVVRIQSHDEMTTQRLLVK